MRRKVIFLVVLALVVVLAFPMMTEQGGEAAEQKLTESVVFQIDAPKYFINNQLPSVEMDVAPFIRNNRTLVPLRFLANALGVDSDNISWNDPVVTISQPGFPVVKLTIGEKLINVDGEITTTDVAPLIENNRTMLPAKFVAEALGYQISWCLEHQVVLVWPKDAPVPEIEKVLEYLVSFKCENLKEAVIITEPRVTQITCFDEAWQKLVAGNERFMAGETLVWNWEALKEHHAVGQWPFVSIVSCSDSRFGPEVVFNQAIGDVFIVRTAGNTVAELALGSLEFSINVLRTPLLVVLGHEGCGAVYATVDAKEELLELPEGYTPDKLLYVVGEIIPAAEEAMISQKTGIALREYATKINVAIVAAEIIRDGSGIAEAIRRGDIVVKGAKSMFDGSVVQLFQVDSANVDSFLLETGEHISSACTCCS